MTTLSKTARLLLWIFAIALSLGVSVQQGDSQERNRPQLNEAHTAPHCSPRTSRPPSTDSVREHVARCFHDLMRTASRSRSRAGNAPASRPCSSFFKCVCQKEQ